MPNPLKSLTSLKKLAARRGWFKDINIVFQGFGPLSAHMFTHFARVPVAVTEYDGEEAEKYIEKGWGTKVFAYERYTGVRHCNSSFFNRRFYQDHEKEIISALSRLRGKTCFIPFASTPSLARFLFSPGSHCQHLQNSSIVQNYFDYKARLAWNAKEIGIPMPPAARVTRFGALEYRDLTDRFPDGFVLQTPLSQAGGGTLFVFSEDDFDRVVEESRRTLLEFFDRTEVKVTPYLAGPSLNCSGCVVNGAVAVSEPDIQIVGDPYFVQTPGQYIGSDFARNEISAPHRRLIFDVMRRVGTWMGRQGYRGNFGVDFLTTVDKGNRVKDVYVSEVNARLVGELQYLADWQTMEDCVPLTFFHLAAWLNLDEITPKDIESYNRSLPPLQGSALLLYTREKGTLTPKGKLATGIYRCRDGKLERVRDGYLLSETRNDDEFVVTNGIPRSGTVVGHPLYGDFGVFLCYIIARESIVDPKNWRRVNLKWREIADRVYQAMGLVPCPPRALPGEKAPDRG
jgi:hypothetical protein